MLVPLAVYRGVEIQLLNLREKCYLLLIKYVKVSL